jgi:hypothetical protein
MTASAGTTVVSLSLEDPQSWGFQAEGLAAHRIAPFNQRGEEKRPALAVPTKLLIFGD